VTYFIYWTILVSGQIFSTYSVDPVSDDTHTDSQDDNSSSFLTGTTGGLVLLVVIVLVGLSVLVAGGYYFMTGKSVLSLCFGVSKSDELKASLV
jgi:hypothetical protein